jgi:hypothetical protein
MNAWQSSRRLREGIERQILLATEINDATCVPRLTKVVRKNEIAGNNGLFGILPR